MNDRKQTKDVWFLCKTNLSDFSFFQGYFLVGKGSNRICKMQIDKKSFKTIQNIIGEFY